jgi:hypothetical protein
MVFICLLELEQQIPVEEALVSGRHQAAVSKQKFTLGRIKKKIS